MDSTKLSTEIAIPLDPKILGEFIANLLGQRRSIEQMFGDRRFEIDMDWLLNLDQVIEQRIIAQNTGTLVSFSTTIYFANGRSLTLEGREAFRSYNDMSNDISVGIDMKWSYLIKFPLAKIPEKQEIRFVAFTKREVVYRQLDRKLSRSFVTFDSDQERLGYFIQFTDVTWGEGYEFSHSQLYTVEYRGGCEMEKCYAPRPVILLVAFGDYGRNVCSVWVNR